MFQICVRMIVFIAPFAKVTKNWLVRGSTKYVEAPFSTVLECDEIAFRFIRLKKASFFILAKNVILVLASALFVQYSGDAIVFQK